MFRLSERRPGIGGRGWADCRGLSGSCDDWRDRWKCDGATAWLRVVAAAFRASLSSFLGRREFLTSREVRSLNAYVNGYGSPSSLASFKAFRAFGPGSLLLGLYC